MTPDLDELVDDLRRLRLHGLIRTRHLDLGALHRAATAGSPPNQARLPPTALESLLRNAIAGLGGGKLGEAATYTFGLAQGTRDWPAQDRRRRAADVYGVSVERFRKHQERYLVEQVAEQILVIAAGQGPDRPSAELGPGSRVALCYPVGETSASVTIHMMPVELIRDVDIHVSPTNVYCEIARIFGDTVGAGLRRAAARRDAAGRIVDDVLRRELTNWAQRTGGGLAVPVGTVAPTGAGTLAEQGIRRIYHAAVAVPTANGGEYHVDELAVVEAIRNVFSLARRERDHFDPPLASLCFPLLGAGRGRMRPETSIRLLWWALRDELDREPHWRIHIATRRYELASALLSHLTSEGARPVRPDR